MFNVKEATQLPDKNILTPLELTPLNHENNLISILNDGKVSNVKYIMFCLIFVLKYKWLDVNKALFVLSCFKIHDNSKTY